MYVPFVSCVFVGGLEVLLKFEGEIKYGVAVLRSRATCTVDGGSGHGFVL
jgi:hypothetical protein